MRRARGNRSGCRWNARGGVRVRSSGSTITCGRGGPCRWRSRTWPHSAANAPCGRVAASFEWIGCGPRGVAPVGWPQWGGSCGAAPLGRRLWGGSRGVTPRAAATRWAAPADGHHAPWPAALPGDPSLPQRSPLTTTTCARSALPQRLLPGASSDLQVPFRRPLGVR